MDTKKSTVVGSMPDTFAEGMRELADDFEHGGKILAAVVITIGPQGMEVGWSDLSEMEVIGILETAKGSVIPQAGQKERSLLRSKMH